MRMNETSVSSGSVRSEMRRQEASSARDRSDGAGVDSSVLTCLSSLSAEQRLFVVVQKDQVCKVCAVWFVNQSKVNNKNLERFFFLCFIFLL